ncbi:MAG TPA: exosortase/archaeosortase family protein [Candidatus Saccharimonadales bacterium]|nr:exosortase/archaeosortase family protein [Candidatus Saccharimonadales bacterium]
MARSEAFEAAKPAPAWSAPLARIPRDLWIAWGAVAIAFFPIFRGWTREWVVDPNYSQGFLIPLISIFLAARALRRAPDVATRPERFSVVGVLLVAAGLLFYLAGTGGSEAFTTRSGFVLTWLGAVWWIAGPGLGRLLTVPTLFLFFSIPVPAVIYYNSAVPLQTFAAAVASLVLQAVGVPVARDGNTLLLPGTALEVADACSGIRSLTVLLALGALWAYLEKGSPVRRALLFVSTVPLAVLGNAVRVSITVLGVYLFGAWFAEGAAHEATGIVVFLVTLGGLFFLSRAFRTDR